MITLLLLLLSSEMPPTRPADLVRWSPDLSVAAFTGFVSDESGRCRGRTLYFVPKSELDNPNPRVVRPTLEEDMGCRDVTSFGWGVNGGFFYIERETESGRVEMVMGAFKTDAFLESGRTRLRDWDRMYAPKLLFGNDTLLYCANEEGGNSLRYGQVVEGAFVSSPLKTAQTFNNIRTISVQRSGGVYHILMSAKERYDGRYKLYAFSLRERGDLQQEILPVRITKGAPALNEHFPKLNHLGDRVAFYGVSGASPISALYVSDYPMGAPVRVDQLRSGVQEGLLDTNAQATYCWAQDGRTLFYLLRSDEHNDPVMYRHTSLQGREFRYPSDATHRMIDISPVNGKLALVVRERRGEHPLILAAPVDSSPTAAVFPAGAPETIVRLNCEQLLDVNFDPLTRRMSFTRRELSLEKAATLLGGSHQREARLTKSDEGFIFKIPGLIKALPLIPYDEAGDIRISHPFRADPVTSPLPIRGPVVVLQAVPGADLLTLHLTPKQQPDRRASRLIETVVRKLKQSYRDRIDGLEVSTDRLSFPLTANRKAGAELLTDLFAHLDKEQFPTELAWEREPHRYLLRVWVNGR